MNRKICVRKKKMEYFADLSIIWCNFAPIYKRFGINMNLFDVDPLFDVNIVKGEGCKVWDEQGQEYLDL